MVRTYAGVPTLHGSPGVAGISRNRTVFTRFRGSPTEGIMSGIVSIELLLDVATEQAVREDWSRLAGAGLSSMGARTSPSHRPHITVLVRSALAEVRFTDAIA